LCPKTGLTARWILEGNQDNLASTSTQDEGGFLVQRGVIMMEDRTKIQFVVERSYPNIVSYRRGTRNFFPPPNSGFILVIDDEKYSTSIRDLKKSGATSIAKTFDEHGDRITRYDLCSKHGLKGGDKVYIEVEVPLKKYRLLKKGGMNWR